MSVPSSDQLKTEIQGMESQLEELVARSNNLRYEIEKKRKQLEVLCAQEGHDFEAESDHDCHSPGWYYCCKVCKYWTRMRPQHYTYKN